MKLTRIRCTNCGAEFENVSEDQRLFRCTRKGCGAVFLVEQGRKFSDMEALQAEQIQRLRAGLSASLSPLNTQNAEVYAKEILAMIPEDFRARAALGLCQAVAGKPLVLRHLLEGDLACPEEEFLEMFPIILAHSEYRELMALEGATNLKVQARGLEDCLSAIERRKEELRRKSDCYADIPRDVFICHSSVDNGKANRVVAALEADGNQCWISSRNLIPDAPDYWAHIERAIRRCKVFLVLCSEAAMLSKDVQRELSLAEQIGNARLEIKLDHAPHTTQFRFFFDGISWIDAAGGLENALAQVKYRVYEALHPAPKPEEAPAEPPRPAPKKKARRPKPQPEAVDPQPETVKTQTVSEKIALAEQIRTAIRYERAVNLSNDDMKALFDILNVPDPSHPKRRLTDSLYAINQSGAIPADLAEAIWERYQSAPYAPNMEAADAASTDEPTHSAADAASSNGPAQPVADVQEQAASTGTVGRKTAGKASDAVFIGPRIKMRARDWIAILLLGAFCVISCINFAKYLRLFTVTGYQYVGKFFHITLQSCYQFRLPQGIVMFANLLALYLHGRKKSAWVLAIAFTVFVEILFNGIKHVRPNVGVALATLLVFFLPSLYAFWRIYRDIRRNRR